MCGSLAFIILVSFIINIAFCNYAVHTNVGVIEGLASSDSSYTMYMGIPFALVNSSNPFGTASDYPIFEQNFEAYHSNAICPQVDDFNNIVGALDCLRLNIYVPSKASSTDNSVPVMIWIYGGGFKDGSGSKASYGPEYLVRHEVILVTLNYRVGPYGFMCLDIAEVPGNQGLKDQYLAIKWVYNNIEAFGGDRNNIALFGESAGGHSIELHLRSLNEILFNKIILESGSAVASTVFAEPNKEAPIKLADYLDYKTTNLNEALKFLASSEPKQVIEAATTLNLSFKPCVEKVFDGVDNFLTTTWVDTPIPKIKNISVLMGFNENERMTKLLNKNDEEMKKLNIFKNNLQIGFNFSEDTLVEMEKLVRHFYIGDEPISEDIVWRLIDFDSDFIYIHPVHRTMKLFITSEAANIFYYMFSYSGGRNFAKHEANITVKGAAHEDEMGYLFNKTISPDIPNTSDQLVLDRMTKMWTNFAKYSDPTPEISDLLPVKWTPVTEDSYHCMKINSSLILIGRPLQERMAFWDLFYKMNKAWLRTFDN